MTGQPTPDRDTLVTAMLATMENRAGTWNIPAGGLGAFADAVLAALEGCAVIDGTPRRLQSISGHHEGPFALAGGVGG